jgi:hypothetical protein
LEVNVRFNLVALTSITGALLAGCGGSQSPIGAPGATPHSRAMAMRADRRDLIYATYGSDGISILTYPDNLSVQSPRCSCLTQFWIQGKTIVQASEHSRQIGMWRYPQGGNPAKVINHVGATDIWGIAVSLAPH